MDNLSIIRTSSIDINNAWEAVKASVHQAYPDPLDRELIEAVVRHAVSFFALTTATRDDLSQVSEQNGVGSSNLL